MKQLGIVMVAVTGTIMAVTGWSMVSYYIADQYFGDENITWLIFFGVPIILGFIVGIILIFI